jgi:hypothetical protein
MSLFGKNDKSSGYFFDQEEDIDPWSSPSVSFFKDKKHRTEKNTHYSKGDAFRELSFDRLDESYTKIAEQRLSKSERTRSKYTDEPHIEINPNQRLFDVYPSETFRPELIAEARRRDASPRAATSSRLPAQKLPRSTSIEPHREKRTPVSSSQNLRRSSGEYAKALWKSEQIAEQMYTDQAAMENYSDQDHSNAQRYDEPPSRAQDFRFLAKVSLTGGVFICCGLVLWWISQQGKYQSDDPDSIVTIPSPQNFKIPNDDRSRLVPLQDALIYGVLTQNNDEGERLLHDATKENVDFEANVEKDEEYLDTVEHVPTKSRSAQSDVSPNAAGLNISGLDNRSNAPRAITPGKPNVQKSNSRNIDDPKNETLQNRSVSIRTPGAPEFKGESKSLTGRNKPSFLQIATLSSVDKANKEVVRLIQKHRILSKYPISVHPYTTEKGTLIYRLLVGPIEAEAEVQSVARTLGIKWVRPIHSP